MQKRPRGKKEYKSAKEAKVALRAKEVKGEAKELRKSKVSEG
jgi:hypothetical protein